MSRHFSLVGTLLRKDLRLFWPFAALIAGLLVVWQIPPVVAQIGPLAGIVELALQFGMVVLVLVVIYEDAVVSLKHDWLTRPISGTTLLLEKALFIVLVIFAPSILGAVVYNLYLGHSVAESLLAGVSSGARGDMLLAIVIGMAFAAVTTGIRQGIMVFLAAIVGLALVSAILRSISIYGNGVPPTITGSSWVILRSVIFTLALAAVAVLWVQYRYRHTSASRVIASAAVVTIFALLSFLSWPRVFSLQKLMLSDPAADAALRVALAGDCFPARRLGGGGEVSGSAAKITPDLYLEEERQQAGADSIAFMTRLDKQAVPAGHRLVVDMVDIKYRGVAGKPAHPKVSMRMFLQRMTADSGAAAADHYWLLPAADYQRLAAIPGVETQLDYSLSLLAPKVTIEFPADGKRAYYPGIGFCGATFDADTGVVAVDCFKPGAQPTQLVAYLEGGVPGTGVASRRADYTPALLDFWGGMRHSIQLRGSGGQMPQVKVTAFEARAHFDHQIVVPGVLGGMPTECPAP
jgi:hypothetical protein